MPLDIIAYISSIVSLSDEDKQQLRDQVQVITCFPRQILTHIGELEQHVYYVEKGLVRMFFYKDAEEVTVYLASEGQMISSNVSFLSGVLSDFIVETLEPCTLSFITRSALESLYQSGYQFEKMGRLIILQWLLYKEKMDILRMTQSPRDRFLYIFRNRPELLERAPHKYIASMLDMKPETFSRFKKKVMEEMRHG